MPNRRGSNLAQMSTDSAYTDGGQSALNTDSAASNPSSNGPAANGARVGTQGDATPMTTTSRPAGVNRAGLPQTLSKPSLGATSSNGRALEQISQPQSSTASVAPVWDWEEMAEGVSELNPRPSKSYTSFSEQIAKYQQHTPSSLNGPQGSAWSLAMMDFEQYNQTLPITASRSARWYASAFHCITAMIGAGVLALPYAMVAMGWALGLLGLVICWAVTLYSLWQLCYMHELDGMRFNRYHELGQYCFGKKLGLWIVVPFQLIVMMGLGIVYLLTAGQLLHHVWQLTCSQPCTSFGLSAWICVFCAFQLFLSQLPNFNALRIVSFISAIMSIAYSTMAMAGSIGHGKNPKATYRHPENWTQFDDVFNAFAALGTLSFAYGGHNVVLEIQATLSSPPSSFKPMMKGVYVAYALVAYCYFGVAITGFWAFGNTVNPNVLFSIAEPKALIIAADLTVVIHMCGSFQLYSMPVFDMIETLMVRKNISNAFFPRLLYRSAYVVLLGFIGIAVPFFGDILAVLGAVAYGPTTFLLPSIMFLIQVRPAYRSPHFAASWFNILVGVIVTALGTIGGMRNLIRTASGYHSYFT